VVNVSLNSKFTSVVSGGLTGATGITIDSQYKMELGKLVCYNLVLTSDHNMANGDNVVSGLKVHYGGFNGVPTVPATNNAGSVAHFGVNDNGDLFAIGAIGSGKWRMSITYICN